MAGGRAHRVVDDDNRQRADAVAAGCDQVHLGDFLVEGAAREHDAERAVLELSGLFLEALRAGVLALVVAPDAVIGMVERPGEISAGIGEREAVARAPMRRRQREHRDAFDDLGFYRNQIVRIGLARQLEQHAARVPAPAFERVRCPGGIAGGDIEGGGVVGLGLHPGVDPLGKTQLRELPAEQLLELAAQCMRVEAGGLIGTEFLGGAALHEQPLHAIERRQCPVARLQRAHLAANSEQRGDETFELGRERDDEIRYRLARELFGRGARGHQPVMQIRITGLEHVDEAAVKPQQAVAAVEVLEPQAETEEKRFSHQSVYFLVNR